MLTVVLNTRGVIRGAEVPDLGAAARVVRHVIEENDYGMSDTEIDFGAVLDNDGNLVARVSYNGRVWSPAGTLLREMSATKEG